MNDHPTIALVVIAAVSRAFGMHENLIRGRRQGERFSKARYAAWAILRDRKVDFPDISAAFSGRDSGTIRDGCHHAARLIRTDKAYALRVRTALQHVHNSLSLSSAA